MRVVGATGGPEIRHLRQHVGDHQQPFRRHLAEANDAPRIDPFASSRIDYDFRLFPLRIGVRVADNAAEVDEKSGLFHHLEIEHDDGAISEEHSHAPLAPGIAAVRRSSCHRDKRREGRCGCRPAAHARERAANQKKRP